MWSIMFLFRVPPLYLHFPRNLSASLFVFELIFFHRVFVALNFDFYGRQQALKVAKRVTLGCSGLRIGCQMVLKLCG